MKTFQECCWWLAFVMISIIAQALAPGLDALAAGVLLLLQERDYRTLAWLLPVFILLQEGMGTRPFGGVLLWYLTIIVSYKMGRWLFEAGNFVFIFLLSTCLGGAYFALAWLLAPLQATPAFDMDAMRDISLLQAVYMPLAWRVLASLRPGEARVAHE